MAKGNNVKNNFFLVIPKAQLMHCLILIRLNFDHILAEEPSMKRPDGFLILILFIVASLGAIFYSSSRSLSYFETHPELQAKFERNKKLLSLNQKLQNLKAREDSVSRDPASINPEPALFGTDMAKHYYSKAKVACYEASQEIECVKDIELIVTQFPSSIWSAEALILLTDVYYRNNKLSQARDIVRVLKTQFKNFDSIQGKVEYLEKQLL